MKVSKKRGGQSSRSNFQPVDGGQLSHLVPFAFSDGRRVADLIWAFAGAGNKSLTCQRCSSQSKEGWWALDMRSTDTEQSSAIWSHYLGSEIHFRGEVGQDWPAPSPACDSLPVPGDSISTLKHNLEYPKHQWQPENYEAMRRPQGNKMFVLI